MKTLSIAGPFSLSSDHMKIGAPVTTVMDMVNISRMPGVRIGSTPHGLAGMRTWYVGASVPWKGVRGLDAVKAMNPAVGAGLTKAIAISRKFAGVRGESLVRVTPKGRKAGAILLIPSKCAKQMVDAGTGEIVATYGSAWQALQAGIPMARAMVPA